jgi:iron complex outermembrane receptor protein
MMSSRTRGLIACVALLLLCALPAFGQTSFGPPSGGTITGTVRNASGEPMPGATVTVINQETGTSRGTRSDANGAYSITRLAPGLYAVAAELPGFGRTGRQEVRLAADQSATVDLSLDLKVTEDVTVTAMKREGEDTVFSTPVSIAAPTEEVLRERGAETIEAVAANVAGFAVQNLGPGQSQVSLRGVSSGQIARDQPGPKEEVGEYLDESVISFLLFTPDISLFDMDRIEVLRGPQGTLFGSGSLGGTVRYVTNQPELGVTRYFAELTGSTISDGNQGGSVKAGFNAPLGSTAAIRVAGYYDRFAGYQDAVQPDGSVDEDVNTGDRFGGRVAVTIAPSDSVTITPRFVYQKVEADGWNRTDIYNILANPFTTTRPPVDLGERQLFTQIPEPYTDEFWLADLKINVNFGDVTLTSITSYTDRDIDVVRDAGALTSSITREVLGVPEAVYTIDAPLDDVTKAHGWTEELRFSGGRDRFRWVAGGFYADSSKTYAQDLIVTGFTAATGIPSQGLRAPTDHLFFSDLSYDTQQWALFGEGTFSVTERFDVTGGVRYYNFTDDKQQIFDGLFGNDNNGTSLVSQPGTTEADGFAPRFIASYKVTENTNLNAQVSKGFRLGGINDPLNVPLCTAQDLVVFGGRPGFKDETAWNYEIGSKSRLAGGRGLFSVSAFYVDIQDLQVVVTAGSCSSRLVFSVPKARSVGGEVEFALAASDHLDFAVSAGYNDSEIRSDVRDGTGAIVSGIETGKRLPSVPYFQFAGTATYQQPISDEFQGYVTAAYQHIGSRFTQVGDDLLGTLDLNSFGANNIGGPFTQSTFTYNPELPAYDIVNLRLGVRHGVWDIAVFANNLFDERALLALDRDRGTRARIGFLVNQPRTIGVSTRLDF